jgi:hypothetical protein
VLSQEELMDKILAAIGLAVIAAAVVTEIVIWICRKWRSRKVKA